MLIQKNSDIWKVNKNEHFFPPTCFITSIILIENTISVHHDNSYLSDGKCTKDKHEHELK